LGFLYSELPRLSELPGLPRLLPGLSELPELFELPILSKFPNLLKLRYEFMDGILDVFWLYLLNLNNE